MTYDSFAEVVQQFNRVFKAQPDLRLRRKLIVEEYREWVKAEKEGNKEQAQKELADLLFVVIGAADALKYDVEAALRQVGSKNWNKMENAHLMTIRDDGKVVKPDGDKRFT